MEWQLAYYLQRRALSFINAFTPDLEKRACVVPLGHGCGTGTLVSVRQLRNLKDSAGVTEAFEKTARLVGCQAALDQIRYAIKQLAMSAAMNCRAM